MSTAAPLEPPTQARVPRRQVVAWGLWDSGSSAFNAVILTFVFSVYLTDSVGADLPGGVSANSWLGWSLGIAGLFIALLAPVIGQRADGGRRKVSVAIWTAVTVASMAGLFAVRDDYHYLALGLVLLAIGSVCFELASVSYNALLRQVSTPATIGRVSGFGWSMGYFGGIVLLLLVYVGLIAGDGGVLGVSTDGGLNIRMVALVAAVWFSLFAIPMFLTVPEPPIQARGVRLGLLASYRRLFTDLRDLYRHAPHTVYFLGASALFRDGLAAIFTFGAVLAVTVYGIDKGDVLIFGVAANVVSALGALTAGWIDDRVGPKAVVIGSLVGLLVFGTTLGLLSGPTSFWIFGLGLCLFVGPAQASARTYMARLAPPGREAQLFGLYATTGRAVSFLAPTLVGAFTFWFGTDRAGIVGILVVLLAGLIAMWKVRPPARDGSPRPEPEKADA